jgi:hypothetical protein
VGVDPPLRRALCGGHRVHHSLRTGVEFNLISAEKFETTLIFEFWSNVDIETTVKDFNEIIFDFKILSPEFWPKLFHKN